MIDLIGKNFVPVAVNLYEVREKKHPGNEFFDRLMKQKLQYQGIWIASPDGKLLGAFSENVDKEKEWPAILTGVLQKSLQGFGPVTPMAAKIVDPHPFRGLGVQADASVLIAGTSRQVLLNGKLLTAPQIDSFKLADKQFAGFRPDGLNVGREFDVPVDVVRRLSPLMTNGSGQNQYPEPQDVTAAKLRGQVAEVVGDKVMLVYTGNMTASHKDRFKEGRVGHAKSELVGYGTMEARTGRMLSLLLLMDTTYRGFPPYDAPQSIVGLAEWRHRE